MPDDFKCPKCESVMKEGFVLQGWTNQQESWIPGTPRESLISGAATFEQAAAKIPIITLRCPICGYLESYAPPPKP